MDILVVTKTHESPVRPLLGFDGFQWLSVCREEVRASGGVCGFGGVACLIRDDLFSATLVVYSNTSTRFMWIQI